MTGINTLLSKKSAWKITDLWTENLLDPVLNYTEERTGGAYPEDLLETCLDPKVLERCLAYFVVEGTRNTKGEPYKPDTIYQVLCGLLRYMRSIHGGEKVPNFLNKRNEAFKRLHAVTDRHYRKLREAGTTCAPFMVERRSQTF